MTLTPPPGEGSQHALDEGARRSREVAEHPVPETWHVVVWRRHKWKIVSLLLLILTELCVLLLGSSLAMGPG